MAEVVPDTDAQQFQHFLSNWPWAEAPVIAEVARRVDTLLGGQPDSGLLLDETRPPRTENTRWAWPGHGTGGWARWATARSACGQRWSVGIGAAPSV